MSYFEVARDIHIGIGSLALFAFWTTAALRKGTPLHRRIGGLYMVAILGVILTALPLSYHAFTSGQPVLGLFLGYLVVITGTAVWLARRAIRHRQSFKDYIAAPYRSVAILNLLTGALTATLGLLNGALILIGMSVIGVLVGSLMLKFASSPPTAKSWWLKRHYIGIVGSGIATHIAFFNLGLRRIVPVDYAGAVQYCSWFLPPIIGLAAISWLNRRYAKRLPTAHVA